MFDGSQTVGTVALIGTSGMLAHMVQKRAPEGLAVFCFDLPEFDITDKAKVLAVLSELKPHIIINCAAFTAVDACEEQEAMATSVNALGVANLAEAAYVLNATLVHISTDYVFSGGLGRPYLEGDRTGPVSAYGRSKLKGEQAILASELKKYFIVRTSWLYGPGGSNFVETILRLAAEKEELRIINDQIGSPTYTGDLVDAIFNLLSVATNSQSQFPSPYGIYHFSDEGHCSWYEFAKEIVALATQEGLVLKVKNILPIKTEDYYLPATRPANSVFDKSKYRQATGRTIPEWQSSLREYFTIR